MYPGCLVIMEPLRDLPVAARALRPGLFVGEKTLYSTIVNGTGQFTREYFFDIRPRHGNVFDTEVGHAHRFK